MILKSRKQKQAQAAQDTVIAPDFDDLYRRYMRPVYAFIAYRINERATAEDITAQVFEKAWRNFDGFDPRRASASTWIFTIARNCLSDHFRKAGRTNETILDENTLMSGERGNDPADDLESFELRREMNEALSGLSTHEGEIVSLKFGAAMTNRDIGKLLDISESNVGTILYRSLIKLKNRLEGGIKND
ncbi:MAG: sigma-70 family RNA polymerase sigma factor [Thermoleophilia bacterium]|jgi:RNA polymerase sigma-70 factor (ECF subfamily)